MNLLSRHADVVVTVAFVIGQLSVFVPMLLLRLQDRTGRISNTTGVRT